MGRGRGAGERAGGGRRKGPARDEKERGAFVGSGSGTSFDAMTCARKVSETALEKPSRYCREMMTSPFAFTKRTAWIIALLSGADDNQAATIKLRWRPLLRRR